MDVELVLVSIWTYGMTTFNWIIKESKLPWLKLDIEFPFEEMLNEAKNIKEYFVEHRAEDKISGYSHKGWSSLCIHGISPTHTNHYTSYGYKSNKEVPYTWTDIIANCPYTYNFFKNIYPCDDYYRVRFMLLEPGGYIAPHNDMNEHKLSPVNLAINHPKNCIMKMAHHGKVPFEDGTAFMLDVGNVHAYYNKSNEDRYHIIVHGNYASNKKWKELVEKSYTKNGC